MKAHPSQAVVPPYNVIEARCSCGFLHPVAVANLCSDFQCPRAVTQRQPVTTFSSYVVHSSTTTRVAHPLSLEDDGNERAVSESTNGPITDPAANHQVLRPAETSKGPDALEGKAKAWVHAGSAFQPSHPNADAAAAPLSSTRHLDMQLQSLQMDLELQVRRNRLNEEEVTQLQDENRDLYDKLAKSQAESYRHEVASKLAMEKVKALTAAAVRAADDPSGQSDQPSYRGEQGLNQVQAFNRRLVQEMEALKTKRDILQRQLGQAGEERESLLAGQTELEDRLKQSASAREVLEARVAKLEGALQAAHAAAGGDTAVSLPTLLEENTLLIAENMKLSAEVTSVATQLELLQSEQQDLEPLLARLQDQEAKISELEDEVIHVKSMHARHQKRSASLEDERDFLKTTEQEFQQELEQLQNMLTRSQEHCAALEEELGAVRQDNECLLGDLQSAQDALAMLQEELCHTQKAQDLTAAEAHALEKLHKADSMVLKRESHLVAEERDRALAETARLRKEQNEMKARLEAAAHPHAAPESKDSGAPERPRVAAAEGQSLRSTVLHRAPDGPSRRDTGSSPLPPALADGSSPFAGGSDPIGISTSDAPPGLQVAYLELQRERDALRAALHAAEDDQQQGLAILTQVKAVLAAALREKEVFARRVIDLEAKAATQTPDAPVGATPPPPTPPPAPDTDTGGPTAPSAEPRAEAAAVDADQRRLAVEGEAAVQRARQLEADLETTSAALAEANRTASELRRERDDLEAHLRRRATEVEDLTRQQGRLEQAVERAQQEAHAAAVRLSSEEAHREGAVALLQLRLEEQQRQASTARDQALGSDAGREAEARRARQLQEALDALAQEAAAGRRALQAATEERDQARGALQMAQATATQLTADLAERETHAAVSFVGLEEGARQRIAELERQVEELRAQGLAYEEQLSLTRDAQHEDFITLYRLQAENARLQEEQQTQDAQLLELRLQLQKATQDTRELTLRLQTLTVEYEALREQNAALLAREGQIAAMKGELREQFTGLKMQLEASQAEKERLAAELAAAREMLADGPLPLVVAPPLGSVPDAVVRLEHELLAARGRAAADRAEAKRLARALEDAQLEATLAVTLQQQVEALQHELRDRSRDIADLQRRLHDLAALRSETDSKDPAEHQQTARELAALRDRVALLDRTVAERDDLITRLQQVGPTPAPAPVPRRRSEVVPLTADDPVPNHAYETLRPPRKEPPPARQEPAGERPVAAPVHRHSAAEGTGRPAEDHSPRSRARSTTKAEFGGPESPKDCLRCLTKGVLDSAPRSPSQGSPTHPEAERERPPWR